MIKRTTTKMKNNTMVTEKKNMMKMIMRTHRMTRTNYKLVDIVKDEMSGFFS